MNSRINTNRHQLCNVMCFIKISRSQTYIFKCIIAAANTTLKFFMKSFSFDRRQFHYFSCLESDMVLNVNTHRGVNTLNVTASLQTKS